MNTLIFFLLGLVNSAPAAIQAGTIDLVFISPHDDTQELTLSVPGDFEEPSDFDAGTYTYQCAAGAEEGYATLECFVREVKGKRSIPVAMFDLNLHTSGHTISKKIDALSPRGYKAPDGSKPATVSWQLKATWHGLKGGTVPPPAEPESDGADEADESSTDS
ncbi:MAG: hypothetical protein QGG40_08430, partial [Myxococcota bacterium]|nr:hypothetical protein [Myxococcota bacterium]